MRPTLALMIGAAMPLLAGAQVPPTPPTPARPAPTPRVAPEPRPPREPRPAREPRLDLNFDFNVDPELSRFDSELFKIDVERLRHESMLAAEHARTQIELHRPEIERAAEMAMRMDLDKIKFDAERMKFDAMEFSKDYSKEFSRSFELGFGGPSRSDKFLNATPRASWSPEDPADSIYRVAREALNRGEWRRAAQMFNEVTKKFPKSAYAPNSMYWEAFCRYRSGQTEDLNAALKILDEGRTTIQSSRNSDEMDFQSLRTRVLAALASRGNKAAEEELRKEAGQNNSCDREEISVRAEALGALGQMDAATALPVVRKVLARRDECTVELRRRALYVAGRQQSPEVAAIILDVAKNDPDNSIRNEAMRWLPRVAGDNAVPQLEEMLRTSTEESQQRMIVGVLNSIDTERARKAVRTIIERNDAAERVRYEAISNFLRDRDGRQPTTEEVAYIRAMYGKLEAPRLREAVIYGLSRVDSPETQQFLIQVVRNLNEQPSLRSAAVQRLGRMEKVTAAEIAKLYDVADTRSLREHILNALSQRKEDEAVDKMIEIARKDTDPAIRRHAINLLSRSTNKKAIDFLANIWNQP